VEKGGYIRGFVDLIFRSGDKFYILDWKSNFIPDGYSRPALEDVMQSHRYHLQASIYVTAVVKWLRSRVPDFDYDRSFGGVFYLFLRGMSPKDPESGVYAFRPTREEAGL
ncbi:MAG: PD-(D/E)XK nuclease family protein, partial [Spirochaetia bacterium]|nr:PD-(D/E)XK nuclease family protein [Spirochaetia bacterium]